mgnify:CR=1 FL=1
MQKRKKLEKKVLSFIQSIKKITIFSIIIDFKSIQLLLIRTEKKWWSKKNLFFRWWCDPLFISLSLSPYIARIGMERRAIWNVFDSNLNYITLHIWKKNDLALTFCHSIVLSCHHHYYRIEKKKILIDWLADYMNHIWIQCEFFLKINQSTLFQ